MTAPLVYFTEGSRIFFSCWKQRLSISKYSGTAEKICQQIVKDCWNGRYFQTSTQHFPQFWTRDFGWCTASLLKLNYKEEVHHTLRYALNRFKEHGAITTTISPRGKPFDFPIRAVDSLPWLIHSIRLSKFSYDHYQAFLNAKIAQFCSAFVNPNTGLLKPELHVSSLKDFAVRKSSGYDNCMLGMLAEDLRNMRLDNPLRNYNYAELLQRHFWNGNYFYDDLSKQEYVAGDANVFPFATGIIKDKSMLVKAVASIRKAGLDTPLPLKYTASRKQINFIWQEQFAFSNYESNALWTHMGLLYIRLVQQIDSELADTYLQRYKESIEKYKGLVEVFSEKGKPYHSWYYTADRSMLWAANYLTLY